MRAGTSKTRRVMRRVAAGPPMGGAAPVGVLRVGPRFLVFVDRSGKRRVGREWRSRWVPDFLKKKKTYHDRHRVE